VVDGDKSPVKARPKRGMAAQEEAAAKEEDMA